MFCHMFCHMFWHAIWHSIPAIHLASILTFLSGILSGISSDFVFVVEVRPGNTLIRSSQLRTLGLHLKLAVAISREGPPTGAKFWKQSTSAALKKKRRGPIFKKHRFWTLHVRHAGPGRRFLRYAEGSLGIPRGAQKSSAIPSDA